MAAGERRPMGSAYAKPGGTPGAAAWLPGPRPPIRPKRPNCPWQSARTTTTQVAAPAWIACAACATAAHTPPPPPSHTIAEKRSSRQPRAAASRGASLRSLA